MRGRTFFKKILTNRGGGCIINMYKVVLHPFSDFVYCLTKICVDKCDTILQGMTKYPKERRGFCHIIEPRSQTTNVGDRSARNIAGRRSRRRADRRGTLPQGGLREADKTAARGKPRGQVIAVRHRRAGEIGGKQYEDKRQILGALYPVAGAVRGGGVCVGLGRDRSDVCRERGERTAGRSQSARPAGERHGRRDHKRRTDGLGDDGFVVRADQGGAYRHGDGFGRRGISARLG